MKAVTEKQKFDKLFLKLHKYHNFRESHKTECKICKAYYDLYEKLSVINFGKP